MFFGRVWCFFTFWGGLEKCIQLLPLMREEEGKSFCATKTEQSQVFVHRLYYKNIYIPT